MEIGVLLYVFSKQVVSTGHTTAYQSHSENQADAVKFFTRTATQKTVTGHFLLCAQYKDVTLEVDQN